MIWRICGEIAKFKTLPIKLAAQLQCMACVRLAKFKIRQNVLVSDLPKLMLAKFSLYTICHTRVIGHVWLQLHVIQVYTIHLCMYMYMKVADSILGYTMQGFNTILSPFNTVQITCVCVCAYMYMCNSTYNIHVRMQYCNIQITCTFCVLHMPSSDVYSMLRYTENILKCLPLLIFWYT